MRSIFLWLALLQAGMLHAQDTLQLPPHAVQAPVSSGEYFFDTDPGFGAGQLFNGAVTSSVPFVSTESIAALAAGVHKLHVRLRDAAGNWSMTNSRFLYILNPALSIPPHPAPKLITKLEYFIDTDPGIGNGISMNVPAASTAVIPNIPVDISSLGAGVHTVNLRFRDSSGAWSHTTGSKVALVSVNVQLPPVAAADSIYALEYFFDNDPGMGNGILLTVPAATQLDNYVFPADISSLADGLHRLFVRTLRGRSLTAMHSFTIGQPLPLQLVSFNVKQQEDDALLSWKMADEESIQTFIPESSTDGIAFLPLDAVKAEHKAGYAYAFADKDIGGYHATKIFYRLRMLEEGGGFSYTPVVSLNLDSRGSVAYPNPFTDKIHILPAQLLDKDVPVTIKIRDIAGRCVYEQQQHAGSDSHDLTVETGALQAGSYFITIEAGDYKEVFRLVKTQA